MLGELSGQVTTRVREVAAALTGAGLATSITTRMDAWLVGHGAFIARIGCALRLAGNDAWRLAGDRALRRQMVLATSQGFRARDAADAAEIPTNLRILYLRLPPAFAAAYWTRVLASDRGELWFAAHTRTAPEEMAARASSLDTAVRRTGRQAPDLHRLIAAAHASSA